MTQKPRAADPADTGSTPGGSAPTEPTTGDKERVVIRNNRKLIDTSEPEGTAADAETGVPAEGLVEDAEVVVDEIEVEVNATDGPEPSGPAVVDAPAQPVDGGGTGTSLGAELEALRAELDERTRDLQRVSAEYANYRKRVDRTAAWCRSRRPARFWPRCCRSWTTWTGPGNTATWSGRSARWRNSSPPRWASSA